MSDQGFYRGKCPECGDQGPHRVEKQLDDDPPIVHCATCKHVWQRGTERPKPDAPPGAVDWA